MCESATLPILSYFFLLNNPTYVCFVKIQIPKTHTKTIMLIVSFRLRVECDRLLHKFNASSVKFQVNFQVKNTQFVEFFGGYNFKRSKNGIFV